MNKISSKQNIITAQPGDQKKGREMPSPLNTKPQLSDPKKDNPGDHKGEASPGNTGQPKELFSKQTTYPQGVQTSATSTSNKSILDFQAQVRAEREEDNKKEFYKAILIMFVGAVIAVFAYLMMLQEKS